MVWLEWLLVFPIKLGTISSGRENVIWNASWMIAMSPMAAILVKSRGLLINFKHFDKDSLEYKVKERDCCDDRVSSL